MNKFVKFSVLPVAALAVACGRGKSADKDAALTADLKRDLAAASASGVELANSSDYQRTRVVSAIESPATSAPVRKRNVHKPVAHPASAGEGQVAKSPEPAIENKVEVAQPEPSTETPIPTVETPTTVAATPRPVPVGTAPASTDVGSGAVGGGSHGGGLGGIGEAIGTIIGVAVIRGGGGGIDHCDPRTDRRGGRGGFPIYLPTGPGPRSGQPPRGPIPINP